MKKIYLLAVLVMLLLHPDFACAQSAVLNEGFENAVFPPAGWSVTDRDADHHGWLLAGQGLKVYAGKQLAISYTCDPKAYPIVELFTAGQLAHYATNQHHKQRIYARMLLCRGRQ